VQLRGLAAQQEAHTFGSESRTAGQGFQAAVIATAAAGAIGQNSLMANFSGRAQGPQAQLPFDDESTADARTQGEKCHRSR
jgi:hypothetical protein